MTYSHYISIGQACPCAYALKVNELRSGSYPFDWIFTDTSVLKDCLSNDFKVFLDESQYYHNNKEYCSDPLRRSHCNHMTYGDKFFRHHCPKCFKEHHEYFKRCVTRFQNVINNKENKILFIWMNIFNNDMKCDTKNVIEDEILVDIMDYLHNHVSASWKLLILECYQNCDFRKSIIIESNEKYSWVQINCKSYNTGVKYKDIIDNEMIKYSLKMFCDIPRQNNNINQVSNENNIWPYSLINKKKRRCCCL